MRRCYTFLLSGLLLHHGGNVAAKPASCRPSQIAFKTCDLHQGFGGWNGPYLEGKGFETLHFTPLLGSSTVFPPAAGTVLRSVRSCGIAPAVSVQVWSCKGVETAGSSPNGGSTVSIKATGAATCTVHLVSGKGYCPTPAFPGGDPDAPVVAVQGYWDGTGAWHGDPGTITLACYVPDPNGPKGSVNSAIGTCINAGYWPKSKTALFLACIRALRADYCGDGQPHTMAYTPIAIHDPSVNTMTKDQCEDGLDYEATWSENGAVCIYHDRWTGMGMQEICTGLQRPVAGSSCPSNDRAVVFTRSACNLCPADKKDKAPACSPDPDPVCAPAAPPAAGGH